MYKCASILSCLLSFMSSPLFTFLLIITFISKFDSHLIPFLYLQKYFKFQFSFQFLRWSNFLKQFNILVDAHFSAAAVDESRYNDPFKMTYLTIYPTLLLAYFLISFYSFYSPFCPSYFMPHSSSFSLSLTLFLNYILVPSAIFHRHHLLLICALQHHCSILLMFSFPERVRTSPFTTHHE